MQDSTPCVRKRSDLQYAGKVLDSTMEYAMLQQA